MFVYIYRINICIYVLNKNNQNTISNFILIYLRVIPMLINAYLDIYLIT